MFLTAFVSVSLRYGDPSDAIGAFGIGLVVEGGILLTYGSPRGYPSLASVEASLRGLGLSLDSLDIDPKQSWGVRRFVGWNGGVEIAVKVLGGTPPTHSYGQGVALTDLSRVGSWPALPLFIMGIGLGLLVSQLNNYALAPISAGRISEATGVNSAAGSFGLSFGLASQEECCWRPSRRRSSA